QRRASDGGGREVVAALAAAQLDRKVQGVCGREERGDTVRVSALKGGRQAMPDTEESLAGWSVLPEVWIAQAALALEVVRGQVAAHDIGGCTQLLGHVAGRLEVAESLRRCHESLREDCHDEHDQGHRHQQFHERETLSSASHGRYSGGE